jgi:hypothetical protein
MFSLLKEYILLEIKETNFQNILDQIKDENENESKNSQTKLQPDGKSDKDISDLEILKNMSIPHNRLKNIQQKNDVKKVPSFY